MTNKDGGAAFPEMGGYYDPHQDQFVIEPTSGMSLRDYFAAKAMQGQLDEGTIEHIVERAYEIADAMLAARATPQPDPVREELAEALEDAREWMSSVEMHLRDSAVFKQSMQRIEAALSKAREGQS